MATAAELVRTTAAELDLHNPSVPLDRMLQLLTELSPQPPAHPERPNATPLTPELAAAFAQAPEVWNSVAPATRRALSRTERARLAEEKLVLDQLKKALADRLAEISKTVQNDADVTAEKAGVVSETTPRDEDGHYIIARPKDPETFPAADGYVWSRELRTGSTTPQHKKALELLDGGVLTPEDYKAATAPGRLVSVDKIEAMVKSPDDDTKARGLRLRELLIKTTAPTTTVYLRPAKK